jgi:hypothetical protein
MSGAVWNPKKKTPEQEWDELVIMKNEYYDIMEAPDEPHERRIEMDEELYAALKLVAFDYEPMYYMNCDGRTLQVSQNQALFALIGNRFGGDGVHTFALPKLDPPAKNLHWIICTQGIWPSRP